MIATRTTISRALLAACGGVLLTTFGVAEDAGVLSRYSLRAETLVQWRLPGKLNEISGLALGADGRLFAVTDEAAIVYELDLEKGRIRTSFAYGNPVMRGDFEGIATIGRQIYLLTSDGRIVAGSVGADGDRLPFTRHETGLGRDCELEGLAQDIARNRLLIVCKDLRRRTRIADLAIFAWSIEDRALVPSATFILPVRDILRRLRTSRLNPSGLAVDPVTGHLILIAARQRALIELTPDGRLLQIAVLDLANRHRQPEGIELTKDGRLLIADEGGSHKARLGIYSRDGAGEAPRQ